MTYTLEEVQENITILKAAYKRAAESGGVEQYSLNSGQGSTTVKTSKMNEIRAELEYFKQLESELIAIQNGSNFTYMRGGGF